MRVESVAEAWGISPRTVYRLIKKGLLPAEIVTNLKPQDRFDIAPPLVSEVEQELDKAKGKLSRPLIIRRYLASIKKVRESGQ